MARDKVTRKSFAVAPLAPETAAQRAQQEAGSTRQAARVVSGKGPTATLAGADRDGGSPLRSHTSLRRMHWQDRNTQGNVFGGV